jgi:hypothetical protein
MEYNETESILATILEKETDTLDKVILITYQRKIIMVMIQ